MKQEKIEHFIKKNRLLKTGAVVVVGVSGGPDSIALLHFLWTIRDKWSLTIIAAHIDHMFRGKESYEDLQFVKAFCEQHQLLFEAISKDVPAFASEHHLSSQVAARECRYDFFRDIMEQYNGDYLALAHHADDQIETMLMRMVRGSYGKAVAGIPLKRTFSQGEIIRPFLCLTRLEIEEYLNHYHLSFRLDPSNDKDDYQRNRFRHHIIPFLKNENPNVAERFQTLSEVMYEDQQLLDDLAMKELDNFIIEKNEKKVVFSINEFQSIPISLQRRCIHLILKYLYKIIPSNVATIHINQLLSMLDNEHPSGTLHFPKGILITRSYNYCMVAFKEIIEREQPFYEYLHIPGEVIVNNTDLIRAEWIEQIPEKIDGIDYFICESHSIDLPLHIRNRNSGDRMTLKGMKGTKKIKDIFIDQKIPIEKRNQWPIVEDNKGQILWVPCLKHSAFSISNQNNQSRNSHHYLLLQYISNNEEL